MELLQQILFEIFLFRPKDFIPMMINPIRKHAMSFTFF